MPFFRKSTAPADAPPSAESLNALTARRSQELRALGELYYESTHGGRNNTASLQRKLKEIAKLDARMAAARGGEDPGPPPRTTTESRRPAVGPCTRCGAALARSDRFCLQCGQPTPIQRSLRPCPQCNRGVEDVAKFCNHCGTAMNAAGRLRVRHPLTGQEASFDFRPGGALPPQGGSVEPEPVEPEPVEADAPPYAPPHEAVGPDDDGGRRWSHELERFARPSDAEAQGFLNRGLDFLQGGRAREAAIEFEAAILQNPREATAHYNLGVARFKAGDTDSAIEAFERCIRLDRTNADAHNDLGLCLAKKNQRKESLEQYNTALRLNPAHSDAHYNVAHLFIEQRAYPDAIHHLEMYLQFSPRAHDFKRVTDLIGRLQHAARSGRPLR